MRGADGGQHVKPARDARVGAVGGVPRFHGLHIGAAAGIHSLGPAKEQPGVFNPGHPKESHFAGGSKEESHFAGGFQWSRLWSSKIDTLFGFDGGGLR